ncbi:MAG TPA: inositol monophosphatase family protein [Vitreimonas sp.]|uniref:inositol monophosphatase family protein n=1 Tax=Vitreimonas sp. TaxID=3069702 RepID=UPI002D2E90A9|nr:inositol monophosphatase family protein [Vitreimonas sp.]HYD88826.1 inositol monophosphatase family protein [Vitreimonas sp.]
MSPLLSAMTEAASIAGEGLLQDFARVRELEIRNKIGPDFVSAADLRAEETIKTMLARFAPDYAFHGEEGGLTGGGDAALTWLVDPLDGTTNFLWGAPLFGTCVALARGDDVLAGVINLPALGEMLWAEQGGGAFLNGRPIRVSQKTALADAVIAFGIPHAGKDGHDLFRQEIGRLTPRTTGVRRTGSAAVDLAYVAAGRFDAYVERVMAPWDMAAGVAIIREAGGAATDADGNPLRLHGGSLCAGPRPLVDQVTAEVRAAATELAAEKARS